MAWSIRASGAGMPEPMRTSSSPVALALRFMWRRTAVRCAAALLGVILVSAVYAPFLANDVAIVWWDDRGLRFPVFADLFNRRSYPQYHDFIFNLVGLLLPALIALWFVFRRRLGAIRRTLLCVALVLVCFGLCLIPLLPGKDARVALWSDRPSTPDTSEALAGMPLGHRPSVLLPIIPHRQDATYAGAVLSNPGMVNSATGHRFYLGTDSSGHDVLARMVFGGRISLTIGIVATGLSLAIGTFIGAVSGYFGGRVDLVLQRLVEIMMCFPVFLLVLTIVAMTGAKIFTIMVVIGLTSWADTARLMRGEFLAQSVRDYVAAGEALGLSRMRIMFRHILPNALTPLLITATFGVAGAILVESGLAFLGMGDLSVPSWGSLLDQGRQNIDYVWLIWVPGIAVFTLVSSLNVLGNALRDALDPRIAR
jgi:peptide/nickel transport system permease protein